MWVKNDVISIYSTMPKEQALPLIITTVAVSLLKVGVLAFLIWLVKFIIDKIKNKR